MISERTSTTWRHGLCAAIATLTSFGSSPPGAAQEIPEPAREFRAAWIAVVHNIDWPSRPGLSPSAQKSEMIALLNKVRTLNMNAVILQVRPSCDAVYASRKEPWCGFVSGRMGQSPGYDPLQFAVEEAHRRGLELHAWFNPFRALPSARSTPSQNHISRRKPGWVVRYENKVWLDPGIPEVQDYSLDVVMDVLERYDIDGVHIDDYFYPYPNNPKKRPIPDFPDSASYRKHGRGSKDEWRRANMNRFVSKMYREIKGKKPWVKFGISPFGIWRPGHPRGIKADLDAYNMIYADSRTWLQKGWCDYLTPQLYWRIEPEEQSFAALAKWWARQNTKQRHLWPGIASSRIGSREDPGRPASEIISQIAVTRRVGSPTRGHSHWSISALKQNRGGLNELLARGAYAQPALVPASPWLGAPARPEASLAVHPGGSGVTVELQCRNAPRWWIVQFQPSPRTPWRTAAPVWGRQKRITLNSSVHQVACRILDAYGNLSAPIMGTTQ